MIEDHSVTCRFGVPPRGRVQPARGSFGSLAAISPGFDALPRPEQAAAINLLLEGGQGLAGIARGLGRSVAQVEALRDFRCKPLEAAFVGDGVVRQPPGPPREPGATAARDRLADEGLVAVERLRIAAQAPPDGGFEMTMDALCQGLDVGLAAARRRLKDLESRKWVQRSIRSGLPQIVTIALAGRCRLDALASAAQGEG
ncbi:hypothetical protein [Hoeflea sp.]|uniref:hypothetical protein n=1 Tax=Hoeflea sp. TaxID=1940281 RepID=UPI0037494990